MKLRERDGSPLARPQQKRGEKVLFRPFSGVSPRFYKKAFFKERDLKDNDSGLMQIGSPEWGRPGVLGKIVTLNLKQS